MLKGFCIAIATTWLALTLPTEACTIIAVGKNATADGSAMVAHTDDAGGGAADLRVIRVPAMDHKNGSQRAVYNFFGGYPRLVTNERGSQYKPQDKAQSLMKPIGFIPQINHTYAYFDQDYGMANEVQLSIVESTCGAKTVGWALDVPYGNNLFGIAELSKIALERCDSARCAIQTMGDLATEYGFYSEDSGDPAKPGYGDSAETLGIADKYGEVWIFHVLTGPANASAVWAAQRLRDDHVTVVANSFTIRQMDLSNADYYMASSNVHSFAQEMQWWNSNDGPFDFTAAYGYHDFNPIRPLYTGRRVWRVLDVMAPSLKLDPRLGCISQYETYPFSVQPDELVTVQKVMNLLRDYYQGTPFDMSKGIAAGPFGAPIRWDGSNKGVIGGWERPISMFRTMFSFVMQTRQVGHDGAGCIVWYGQSTPHATVYVPFSCRQTEIPSSYTIGKQSEFNFESAWWAFDFVKNWSLLRFDSINVDIQAKINQLQTEAFALRKRIDAHVRTLNTSEEIDEYIQAQSNAFASKVINEWWSFAWQLVSKFSDGYITTGEEPDKMKTLGYPKWWLEMSEFAKWPGSSFTPRDSILREMEPSWNLGDKNETTSIASASTQENNTSSMNFLQIGGVLISGILIGAATVYLRERSRRKGYNSIQ